MPTALYELHEGFYTQPTKAVDTITLKQLQGWMIRHHGRFIAVGHIWVLQHKRVCPGVYEIHAVLRQSLK